MRWLFSLTALMAASITAWAAPAAFPRVFEVGEEAVVSIEDVDPEILNDPSLLVQFVRADSRFEDNSTKVGWNKWREVKHTIEDGQVKVPFTFPVEEEYTFRVVTVDNEGKAVKTFLVPVYAVEKDLINLRPYKGDFHLHSTDSDGNIPAEQILAKGRAKGLDFMAVTDHGKYAPSERVIAKITEFVQDMKVYNGEEVHPNNNDVHIINLGGSFSVNDYMKNTNVAETTAAIDKIMAELPQDMDESSRYQVASSEVAFDLIRDGKGIAMFCHPYWRPYNRNYINGTTLDAMYERQKFDVLEVIGGFDLKTLEENALSVGRYQQERAKGKVIPVAGVSDAHTYEPGTYYWWYYTVVFAESPELADLATAIRANRSLAVEDIQNVFPRYYGDFRLIKYQYFLNREFFPWHDKLCAEEAELLEKAVNGDAEAAANLAGVKGQVPEAYERFFGKTDL